MEHLAVKTVYIFTGGNLERKFLHKIIFQEDDRLIGVDKGAEWLIEHDIVPDYILGDFDSAANDFLTKTKEKYGEKISIFPSEKDETDTELGMRFAISLQPKEIIIFGGTGSRLDHVLANIHVLLQGEEQNIPSSIVDSHNRIQMLLAKQKKDLSKGDYDYVSLLPFSDEVTGITIQGFKYLIENGSMKKGTPYGISNEIIHEKGTIYIENGILLVIESKD